MTIEKKYSVMKIMEQVAINWIATTYVLFLVSKGQSLMAANTINLVYMVSVFFLDPPTGFLGDRFGHRKIYTIGLVLFAISGLRYGFGNSMSDFMVAEFVAAIGSSFMSEALEAWLRNEVGQSEFNRIRSGTEEKGRYLGIITALLGSLLAARFSYVIPWFLLSGTFTISVIVGLVILRDGRKKVMQPKLTLKELFGVQSVIEGFMAIKYSRELRGVALVSVIAYAAFQAFNMFWTVTFRDLGAPGWLLGWFWILIAVAIGKGAGSVKKVTEIAQKNVAMAIMRIGAGIAIGSIVAIVCQKLHMPPVFVVAAALAGFLAHEFFRGRMQELLSTYRNRFIKDKYRATINSSLGSLRTLGAGLGLLLSGFASEHFSTLSIWIVSGAVLIVLGVWYSKKR